MNKNSLSGNAKLLLGVFMQIKLNYLDWTCMRCRDEFFANSLMGLKHLNNFLIFVFITASGEYLLKWV